MKWVFGIFVSAIFCCALLLADLRLDHGTFVLKINQSKSKPSHDFLVEILALPGLLQR